MASAKVLLVDDARAVIETVGKALQRLGVPAANQLTASNAADALRLFKEHNPHLVFMDIDLGGERGDLTALRILDASPLTKVVVMTGLGPDEPRVRAVVSAGAYAVIDKPVRLARLRELLDLIQSEEKGLRRVA